MHAGAMQRRPRATISPPCAWPKHATRGENGHERGSSDLADAARIGSLGETFDAASGDHWLRVWSVKPPRQFLSIAASD